MESRAEMIYYNVYGDYIYIDNIAVKGDIVTVKLYNYSKDLYNSFSLQNGNCESSGLLRVRNFIFVKLYFLCVRDSVIQLQYFSLVASM